MEALIIATANWVRQRMDIEGSHDWWHVERVWNMARRIAAIESALGSGSNLDQAVIELASLLHDIADAKFHDGDETVGPRLARQWLEGQLTDPSGSLCPENTLSAKQIDHIVAIISTMSFRHGVGGFVPNLYDREYAIVRDADRLDAMGAIGIARAFAFGGARGRPLYDPVHPAGQGSTLAHFHEKLMNLKDLMLTETGRKMADQRHHFMEQYLAQFLAEWAGGQ